MIGAGDFGIRHVSAIARMAEFELCAVADRDASRAQTACREFGGAPFADLGEVIAAVRLDAVVIATPPHAHATDIVRAVGVGLPALVEKPVVATVDELDLLAALPAAQRDLIHPAHVSRYLPAFAALRERLATERIRLIRAVRVVPAERVALHGDTHPALAAMVHDLDLVRALVGAELENVTSVQNWSDDIRPYPQSVAATLSFDDGTIASIDNTWTMPHTRQYIDARLEVFADGFSASLSLPSGGLRWADADGPALPDVDLEGDVYGIPAGALATELRSFAAAVADRTTRRGVTLDEAEWTVRTALRIAADQPHR